MRNILYYNNYIYKIVFIVISVNIFSEIQGINTIINNDKLNLENKLIETNNSVIKNTSETSNLNCSDDNLSDFPNDLFTKKELKSGAVILHAFFGFYCFILTAFVCNDYLLPALDIICNELRISSNVAGATFLATASCFPELFVNVVGTFLTESDLGVGTVVGGAVFNTFATPAFGALSAAQGIQLDSYILSRDCIIYVISVGVLVLIMWDGRITWYESTSLMILFTTYFIFLFLNDIILRLSYKLKEFFCRKRQKDINIDGISELDDVIDGIYRPFVHEELKIEYRNSILTITKRKEVECGQIDLKIIDKKLKEELEQSERDLETPFRWGKKKNFLSKLFYIFTWPLKLILYITIPDIRYKKLRNLYPITFIMCIIWIAVSSYLVSWMMSVVGVTLGIPDSIVGITFLSAGGNMPELVSIVILSRQGNGDMAMSNTLGANTLDILMCLGLPWAIKSIMTKNDVIIQSGAIAYSVLSIILCVIGFYTVTRYYKYQLNRQVGIACLIMYTLFLIISITMESNVFHDNNLPKCDR